MNNSKDPLYQLECAVSDEFPDETIYYHIKENPSISYSLHKSLIGHIEAYGLIKRYNDEYHKSNLNKKLLVFCPTRTSFLEKNKSYIILDEMEGDE